MRSDGAFGASFGAYSVSINAQTRQRIDCIERAPSVHGLQSERMRVDVFGDQSVCSGHSVVGEKRGAVDRQIFEDNVGSKILHIFTFKIIGI